MLPGFERIVEERIREAQRRGDFENLEGRGKPLTLTDESNIPEDLRLAYKVMKNAEMMPPEIALKKEILRTEDLLVSGGDTSFNYTTEGKLDRYISPWETEVSTGVSDQNICQVFPFLCLFMSSSNL